MTPTELLAALRAKRIDVRSDGGRLIVRPASALTNAERTAVREHAEALLELLRAPAAKAKDELVVELTVDAILRQDAEAYERFLRETMRPRPPVVVFRMTRGPVQLRDLRPHEVRALESAGKLSPDEVRLWARRRWLW